MDNPVFQAIAAVFLLILTGLGINKARKTNGTHDEIGPDDKPTRRESFLMIMTDRIHKIRQDLDPILNKLHTDDAKLDLRVSQNRADIDRISMEMQESFKAVHVHLNSRCDQIERQLDKAVERIWQKLDAK